MLQATGGETVIADGVTTYGHFDRVPVEFGEDQGGYAGGTLTTSPSLVIADTILANIGMRKGIDRTLTVGGTRWIVANVVPADEDGGTIRVMLRES